MPAAGLNQEGGDQTWIPPSLNRGGIEKFIDPEGGLKGAGKLFEIYEEAGLSKLHDIVCHADSLQEATFHYFLLRLLGFPRVRVACPKELVPS